MQSNKLKHIYTQFLVNVTALICLYNFSLYLKTNADAWSTIVCHVRLDWDINLKMVQEQ